MAIDPAWPRFGGLAMAGVFLLIAIIGVAPPPLRAIGPASGLSWSGGAGSRDKGADRSKSAEHGDPGRPCARLAAADSLALLGFLAAQWVQKARGGDRPSRIV